MITKIMQSGEHIQIICLRAEQGDVSLAFSVDLPNGNICGMWYPGCGFDRSVKPEWEHGFETVTTVMAPVLCCFDEKEESRILAICSEVRERVLMSCGIVEETGKFRLTLEISLDFLKDNEEGQKEGYEAFLCLSGKREPYEKALGRAVEWWDTLQKQPSLEVPPDARMPVYSTWYSYHQEITGEAIEAECEKAAALGMKTIIVDDGWQTEDRARGYAYCGDWQVFEGKLPDFACHVKRVHELGMKYMIWFAVPFVGVKSRHWEAMKDKLLTYIDHMQAGVLDPRYPQVREYVASSCERLVSDYGLDGLKLDFVDEFYLREEEQNPQQVWTDIQKLAGKSVDMPGALKKAEGMDIHSVQEAVGHLMQNITKRLLALKPDVLIEFRQKYIGPAMRRYGNLFRVDDCPGSYLTNRVGIADLRLTSGDTAVHSDMMLWPKDAAPEEIAMHLINSIFGTMQISVKLNELNPEQEQTLKFWLDFAGEHRELLQQGNFRAHGPLNLYPILVSKKDKQWIVAVYEADKSFFVPEGEEGWLLYGAQEGNLCLGTENSVKITEYNPMGEQVKQWIQEPGISVKHFRTGTMLHILCRKKG